MDVTCTASGRHSNSAGSLAADIQVSSTVCDCVQTWHCHEP